MQVLNENEESGGGELDILSDDYLVRVKAQVMTRDDSTGGWVPMGGGGMSIVGLRKLVIANGEDLRHEYLIHGQRIADQSVVLNCVLKKDVQYNKANPTFHHWKTEEKRFGLTFQSSADARAFDKGVQRAIEDLLDGTGEIPHDSEVGDDDVFVAVDLPLGRKDSSSQSASTASTTTSSPSAQSPALSTNQDPFYPTPQFTHPHANHHHLHRVHYVTKQPARPPNLPSSDRGKSTSSDPMREDTWVKLQEKNGIEKLKDQGTNTADDNSEGPDYSYVHFAKENRPHDYSYPTIESLGGKTSHTRQDSISSIKKPTLEGLPNHPPLPTKTKKKKKDTKCKKDKKQSIHLLSQRARCVNCHETFVISENWRGSCEDAPDKVLGCIERVSCVCCARGLVYHCMADADGDYGHTCVCDRSDRRNCQKWTALTILSLFVPCLWCYWPLMACHRCGVSCGCCGGRHKAE